MSDDDDNVPPPSPQEEKQCKICLDGVSAERELGRLIRPCLCKGTMSYVHVKCLNRWRTTSSNPSAFFECRECRYRYRFNRTQVLGIATNPVIVGTLACFLFTCLVMASSFITTFSMSLFEEPAYHSFYFVSPVTLAQDLIRAAFRILQDAGPEGLFDEDPDFSTARSYDFPLEEPKTVNNGLLRRFIRRFVLGLPMVGAGSLVQMLLSAPLIGPLQWIARQRGSRRRRDNGRDLAAAVIIALLVVGALRALYQVYRYTENLSKKLLLRAEDAILEVN